MSKSKKRLERRMLSRKSKRKVYPCQAVLRLVQVVYQQVTNRVWMVGEMELRKHSQTRLTSTISNGKTEKES